MWKSVFQPFIANNFFSQQIRTTYVVKRRNPAPLAQPHTFPLLRKKHRIYDTVQDNAPKPGVLTVLLKKYVEGLGGPGDVVHTKESKARYLILSKAADYATEENVKKMGKSLANLKEETYSSRHVGYTVKALRKLILHVIMNKDNPWTIEPWHIRAAFRKAHFHVPEHCFTMPSRPISGPDMSIERKEFYIIVTINNTEKVPVRARVHHWATKEKDRLPIMAMHWKFPAETVFPEDVETAKELNLPEIIPPVLSPDDTYEPPKRKRFGSLHL